MLLALDTATATASVAVYDRQRRRLLSEITWQARRRHTQDLMPAVQQALAYAGAGVEQITALAVTTGPGSFTGVRIGISAVKGLGLGMAQTPQTVGVPTLSVTAAPWLDAAAGGAAPAAVCAFVQAGRGRYNWAFFDPGDLLRRPGREEHGAGAAGEFCAALAAFAPQPVWLAGEPDAAGARGRRTGSRLSVGWGGARCAVQDTGAWRTGTSPRATKTTSPACSRSTCRIPNASASFPSSLTPCSAPWRCLTWAR